MANLKGGGKITGWILWAAVMAPGCLIIAIVKKLDKSGTAPTKEMFECVKSVATVAQTFGDCAPTPMH